MRLHIGEDREDVGRTPAIGRIRLVRVKLIDPVHVVEQREYSAELLVVLIMRRAGQHRPELVRAHEAERPLCVIGGIF